MIKTSFEEYLSKYRLISSEVKTDIFGSKVLILHALGDDGKVLPDSEVLTKVLEVNKNALARLDQMLKQLEDQERTE